MTTTIENVFPKTVTITAEQVATLKGMGVRKATKSGFVVANVDGGGVVVVTMWNPLTDESMSFIADDIDRPASEFHYSYVIGWKRFGGSAEVRNLWNRKHGIVSVGDEVEVFKGRKFPKGMRATVASFWTWHGDYGKTAEYVVTTDGDRIPKGNVRPVA